MTKTTPADAFKAFNDAHTRGPDSEYGSTRLAHTPNGASRYTAKRFPDVLRKAADLVEQHGTEPLAMADLYTFLSNAQYMMPELPDVWCVVKHYAAHDDISGQWGPRVWTAHLTEEQATEFAAGIEGHYRRRNAHLKLHDTFVVEKRWATAIDFIHPDCTIERYLRGLS